EMQKDVGKHDHHTVAAIARRGMAKDALPDLTIADEIADGHGWLLYPLSATRSPLSAFAFCGERVADSGKRSYSLMNDSGLLQSPRSCWNFLLISTTIWPSSPMLTAQRSSGRGAGPSKLMPLM